MKRLTTLTICGMILMSKVWGTVVGSKPVATSDDFNGYTTDATNISQSNAHDSTVSGGRMGSSGAFYYYNVVRFPSISIPQGSTVDSAFYVTKSACVSCTDSAVVRVGAYNADNGIQVTDTAAVRTTWAAKATTLDSAWLSTVTSWGFGVYQRLPFDNLHGVIHQIVNRAGWVSGNSITLITVGVSGQGGTSRPMRTFDDGATSADSLLIYYTAGGGGSPSATPNVVIRTATLHTTTLRAPEKLFYRQKDNWRW